MALTIGVVGTKPGVAKMRQTSSVHECSSKPMSQFNVRFDGAVPKVFFKLFGFALHVCQGDFGLADACGKEAPLSSNVRKS
jgi:hypothetical protein